MSNPPNNHQGEMDEEQSLAVQAGEYALGVLEGPACQAFEARLANDAQLQQELATWTQHFADWSAQGSSALANPAVSPLVWQRIQSSLWPASETAAASASATVPTFAQAAAARAAKPGQAPAQGLHGLGAAGRHWLDTLWRVWAGFATACAVGLAVYVAQPILQPDAQQPRYVAVLKSPDKTAEWLIEALPNDTVRLYQLGQLPVAVAAQAQGKSLELWTKAGADAPLMSLGLVQLGKPWVLPAKALPALQNNQLFAVSLEPPNGAPHGQPTGPVVLAGEAVALR